MTFAGVQLRLMGIAKSLVAFLISRLAPVWKGFEMILQFAVPFDTLANEVLE